MGSKGGSTISFRQYVLVSILNTLAYSTEGKGLNNHKNIRKTSIAALRTARVAIKKPGGRKKIRVPIMIRFECRKTSGFLPFIPIFAGIFALGLLAGGANATAKTVIDAKKAVKKLEEDCLHYTTIKAETGKGLYLRKQHAGAIKAGMYYF